VIASLIIAVYKRTDFLELVLASIENQTFRDMEVVIAEDDQAPEVGAFVKARAQTFPFPLKHVNHEDRGFLKNRILNQAVLSSEGRCLIFIDGDCILHRKFVEEHAKRMRPDTCLFGRRAMLSKKLTERLLEKKSLGCLSFTAMLRSKTRRLEDAIYAPFLPSFRDFGIKGSNFSLPRDLFYKINGFDEDFEKPFGGEDDDIERRLRLIDTTLICTKFKTIQYHLDHGGREGRSEAWESEGRAFYQKKVEEKRWRCRNGLVKD
jgi:glycosyltransferase involved in cell wall biosynthesis